MQTRLKTFETITILCLNIIAISCFPNILDFELDISKDIFNSENVIIDLSKKFNLNNDYFIKIISYEGKELEFYSSQNPGKKLKAGDYIPIQEKLILKVKSIKGLKLYQNYLGRIIYSLISKYQPINQRQNIIKIKLSQNKPPINLMLRNLQENSIPETSFIITTTVPPKIPTTQPPEIPTTIPTEIPPSKPPEIPTTITSIPEILMDSTNKIHVQNKTDNHKSEETIEEHSKTENNNSNVEENFLKKNESYCNPEDILNNTCKDGKMNLNNIDYFKNYALGKIKQSLNENADNNLQKIKTGNVIIQYGSLDEQKESNDNEASSIDLGDCEKTLKELNSIDQNKSLIVYKVDVKNSDSSSTYVQYEVYNPDNMNPLNLSVCEKIIINTPVDIGTEMEDIYNSLYESGYNLFNSEDSFYQDICTTYTTANGTDMLLSDRKKEIYSSTSEVTLCQTGCTLESYNSYTKKASCNCETSSTQASLSNVDIDTLFDKEEIKSSFYDTLSNSNFRVLKCYKTVFSSKFLNNVGGIFMTFVGLGFLGFHFLSYCLYQTMINSYIMKIIQLNGENIEPNPENNPEINDEQKDDKKNMNEKKEENNEENKEENNKENKEEKKKKGKKKKKVKKNKKKKAAEEAQFPPKKSKKKNIIIDESKTGYESSKNDMANEKVNNLDNITNNKNDIIIYPNDKTGVNNKIKDEKNIMTSKDGLEKTNDDKKDTNEEVVLDITKLNDQEINTLKYEDALKIDKRTYFQYYWSLLKKKHLILFTFYPANDYNLFAIKVSLFLLSFGLYFTINGFFFSDDTMHKLYEDKGKYNIVYRIPQILFSTIISAIINVLLKQLSLSEANILTLKQETDSKKLLEKSNSIKRCLRLKFLIYFILSVVFMAFFWYFISCFCAVYTNTQMVLIKDTLVSYALSMVYPFGLNLLPGFFRIPALRAEKGDKGYMYKISLYVALI